MQRVLAGLTGVLAAAAAAGVAAAEPAPPPDPALIGPPAEAVAQAEVVAPPDPFAAASEQTKSDQVGTLADLLSAGATSAPAEVLNQGVGLSAPPPVDPLAAVGLLYPQYYRMPSGENASPYVLQTDAPAGPFARVDAFKGVHALIHGGLGRMPGGELGQPLAGTAPAPGTNVPPGLEQFYAGPVAGPDPLLLPVPSAPPVG